jgi:hypothetical protein
VERLPLGQLRSRTGDAVNVFLLGKGVECESLDTEHFAVTQALQELADRGGKIDACGTCLKLRNAEAGGVCALSTLQDLSSYPRKRPGADFLEVLAGG